MHSTSPLERHPLVPTTGNSGSPPPVSSLPSQLKRKHSDEEVDGHLPENFTARLPSQPSPVVFKAVALLARACLPLAWINTNAKPAQHLSPTNVFEAVITSVQEWEQRVLVARRLPNSGLFAIERVGQNFYTTCPLQNFVTEDWCRSAAIGIIVEINHDLLLPANAGPVHTRNSSTTSLNALPTPKSPKRPANRRGALARQSILMPKNLMGEDSPSEMSSSPSVFHQALAPSNTLIEPASSAPPSRVEQESPFNAEARMDCVPTQHGMQGLEQSSVDEVPSVEHLRSQYFDHLYCSKTSLAFYVKGPLSRARARVRTAENSSAAITDLSEFYKQCVLPTAKIDLKYKETLAKIANECSVEEAAEEAQKKKSGKKRVKLGKDSLWPDEEPLVRQWARTRDLVSTSATSRDHGVELRKQIADLRTRETKMQLLLILEVMLLELAASRLLDTPDPSHPGMKAESIEEDSAALIAKTPHKQSRKKRELANELETMVDRLCIWHSIGFEEFTLDAKKGDQSKTKSNDTLRDFCKDVLIPFYSVKLPEQIKSLSRKLGGSGISPRRPTAQAGSSQLSRSKPTGPTVQKNSKAKLIEERTLKRVLSEDHSLRHPSPPILPRVSVGPTNPIIPSLKREPSERPSSRAGMLSRAASFSSREVDFIADSKVHEAKRQKLDRLAQQKRDLALAIDALKKPNRGTVAGAIMDELEQRKGRNAAQVIQIAATPRARRVRDQPSYEPELPPMPMSLMSRSHEHVVPSSTVKSRFRVPSSSSIPRASATKRAVLTAIHETPSRGLGRLTSNPLDLHQGQCSPIPGPRVDGPALTHASPRSKLELGGRGQESMLETCPTSDANVSSSQSHSPSRGGLRMSRSLRPVLFTPLKKSDVSIENAFRDAPEIPEKAGKMMDRVMGGRGVETYLDLNVPMIKSSSPLNLIAGLPASGGLVAAAETSNWGARQCIKDDEGDIYAQLGWDDDFDL